MTIQESINVLSNFIQSLISKNPYAQSLSEQDMENLNNQYRYVSDKFSKPSFNTDTYEDIAFSIYMDYFCEHQFSLYQNNDYISDTLPTQKQVQDDFEIIYSILTSKWCKFSSNSEAYILSVQDVSMLIFQKIYDHYPVLCAKLLPIIAFVIADNYHTLAEKIFTKGNRCIPKKIPNNNTDELIQYFEQCFFYAQSNLYIYSLLNCKSTNFTKDSQEEGFRIQHRILSYCKKKHLSIEEDNAHCLDISEIDPFFTDLENYIAKIYSQELKKKVEQRKKMNFAKASIPLGENFLSFIALLKGINEKKRQQKIL